MKIYLDTSVISALFDDRNPERKALTEEFFSRINIYDTHISELTIAEIKKTPDQELKGKMQKMVKSFLVLEINEAVEELANQYVRCSEW